MATTSRAETPVAVDEPSIEVRAADLGEWSCTFERHKSDDDPAPLFAGLPDDRCQCVHLGYVLSGKIVFRYADHDETTEAGGVYVATPGHTPLLFAGTELVEFTKTTELNELVAHLNGAIEAMKAGAR
jgi:hypothetical protein